MRENLHEGNAQIHHLPCRTQEQQVQRLTDPVVVLMSGGILTASDATRKIPAPARPLGVAGAGRCACASAGAGHDRARHLRVNVAAEPVRAGRKGGHLVDPRGGAAEYLADEQGLAAVIVIDADVVGRPTAILEQQRKRPARRNRELGTIERDTFCHDDRPAGWRAWWRAGMAVRADTADKDDARHDRERRP
jgi:hypothetical protein